MKKYQGFMFYLILALFFSSVRHVGSGGGEAELKLLLIAKAYPLWAKACIQNPELCWLSRRDQEPQIKLPVTTPAIIFVSQGEQASICRGNAILIVHETLYFDSKTPREDRELNAILVNAILTCQGDQQRHSALETPQLLPMARSLAIKGLYAIHQIENGSDSGTDIIVSDSSDFDFFKDIQLKSSCQRFQVVSSYDLGFEIQCLDKEWAFWVERGTEMAGEGLSLRFKGSADD